MFTLDQSPGRTAIIDGKQLLFFSGYSYLGMGHNVAFLELVKDGLDKYGVLHPSSRISNTQLSIFEEMESLLSTKTLQEDSVVYSSGFLAGRAVVEYIESITAECYVAPATHPAILSGGKQLIEDWATHFIEIVGRSAEEEFVLISDSVNPLTATINDFTFLENVPTNKKITCVIDDSHGIGLLGENGEGIVSSLPKVSNVDYIITCSLSKAFHINGGAVSCTQDTANRLRQSPFYTATTSISPALIYAFICGQDIYQEQRKKLTHSLNTFINLISPAQINYQFPLPIFILPKNLDQLFFEPHNIIISSFAYPNPQGETINRIVLNALHAQEDLEKVAGLIVEKIS